LPFFACGQYACSRGCVVVDKSCSFLVLIYLFLIFLKIDRLENLRIWLISQRIFPSFVRSSISVLELYECINNSSAYKRSSSSLSLRTRIEREEEQKEYKAECRFFGCVCLVA